MKLIYGNTEWAGYSTTDRSAYLKNLMKATGKGANDKLDPGNLDEIVKILAAIAKQENATGRQHYSEKDIKVMLMNSTGSDVTTQTNQAAH